jgi:PilZ domain
LNCGSKGARSVDLQTKVKAKPRSRTDTVVYTMSSPPTFDRRKFERLRLKLPLQFRLENGSEVIDCFTENISSEGVYFISLRSLTRGERLEVDLVLPLQSSGSNQLRAHLKCCARVARVDESRERLGFGVACRIETYSIWFEPDRRRDQMFRSAKA